jgi:hypothetical protein
MDRELSSTLAGYVSKAERLGRFWSASLELVTRRAACGWNKAVGNTLAGRVRVILVSILILTLGLLAQNIMGWT